MSEFLNKRMGTEAGKRLLDLASPLSINSTVNSTVNLHSMAFHAISGHLTACFRKWLVLRGFLRFSAFSTEGGAGIRTQE